MGVAVADKAPTPGRLVDGSLEDPEVLRRTAEAQDGLGVNADAMIFLGDSEKSRRASHTAPIRPSWHALLPCFCE